MRIAAATLALGVFGLGPMVRARPAEAPSVPASHDDVVVGGAHAFAGGLACSGAHVQFARDVEPILMSGCGGEYCHGSHFSTPSRAYAALVGQSSSECDGRVLVVPGNPEASYVIEKVTKRDVCAGAPMPRGADNTLRAEEVQVLYDWICEGARND